MRALSLVASVLLVACGSNASDEAPPSGGGTATGAGGVGGTGGGTGNGGAAGIGNEAGAGGTTGSGGKSAVGGSSGASGKAGASGVGGASGKAGSSGGAGASASAGAAGSGGASCVSAVIDDTTATEREACAFAKGDLATKTLAIPKATTAAIPIEHVVIVMNENRSFDHYLGRLPESGKADVDGWPAGFTNPDLNGVDVAPHRLTSGCLPIDPPHNWAAMHDKWDGGKMDHFVTSDAVKGTDGHYAMGYYDEQDLPFYHWLAKTFAISDRYFSSVMGPTWPNRDYLYAATSNGGKETGTFTMAGVPTIFDAMTKAGVSWHVYTNGTPRQDCLGWSKGDPGTGSYADFLAALKSGDLPAVSFVDPSGSEDEHPANDVHGGEAWAHEMIVAAMKSSVWPTLALFYTYDEAGGLADHVPPPKACIPSADQTAFDRLGFRVPIYVVSPWARPGYVSHATHEHASVLRFVELLHGLPALTDRDANADAMLDLFDFGCPALLSPPAAPAPAPLDTCP